jgi:hypothetical protein
MGIVRKKSGKRSSETTAKGKKEIVLDELEVLFLWGAFGIVLLTVILLVVIGLATTCSPVNSILAFIGIASASLAFGAAIGFLFGIPRAQKVIAASENNHETQNALPAYYSDNTNLEEISDWLTKIILGLTLVELKPILARVHDAAVNSSQALAGKCCETCTEDYYTFAYSTLVFYFIAGGGLSYLWTRSNLQSILEARKIKSINRQLEARNNKLEGQLSKGNKVVTTGSSNQLGTSDESSHLRISEKLSAFRKTIEELYERKPIKYTDDLQLGRWGGTSAKGGVTLSASYNGDVVSDEFFGIDLVISSSGEEIGDLVAFFLHDTFPNEIEIVAVENGRATLTIQAFEAFTVGAKTESGTELELDLNKVKGFPPEFYY